MTIGVLSKMFSLYGDGHITKFEHLADGFANESYRIDADDDSYVIKVLRLQQPEGTDTEIAIQKQISNTPHYLQLKNGRYVGLVEGNHFVISKFVDGESPKRITVELAHSFGEQLALIHDSLNLDGLTFHFPKSQWLNPKIVREEVDSCKSEIRKRLQKVLESNSSFLQKELPKVLIHGDLRPINVFAEGNKITTVFDFETAEFTFRILDIAQTYLALAPKNETQKDEIKQAIIKGYDSKAQQGLTTKELACMQEVIRYVSVAVGAWCFNNHGADFAERLLTIAGAEV